MKMTMLKHDRLWDATTNGPVAADDNPQTAWQKTKEEAGVRGRFHDTRHTFITDLAESGQAGDETIRDLAGHVSKQMLKHYSHIRMQAKRRAVEALSSNGVQFSKVETEQAVAIQAPKESPKVAILT